MLMPQEELTRITRERLAQEANAARIVKAAGTARPGVTQRAVHRAGETFVSLGNWMKQLSQAEPASDPFEIRFNL
jgi:hypothetical protein